MISIFQFFAFYILIINSIIGIGYFFAKIISLDNQNYNYGYIGLLGIFGSIIISYFSHYFVAHNYYHNSIFILFGFSFFLFFISREKNKYEIIKLNLLFVILFICLFIYKNHDDFSYYHFAYINYLNNKSLIIGIGNFNHGFRTQSSIFYLNSLFFLPIIKNYLFNVGALMIMGFSLFSLIKILEKNSLKKKFNQVFFLSTYSIIFILIFFYRIAEHGTDRSAQILTFLLIIELYFFFNYSKINSKNLSYLIILFTLIISLKAFYILYLLFLIPLFFHLIFLKRHSEIILIFKNNLFKLAIFLLINIFIVNFFNTGCLIYPVYQSCFENFLWSIPVSEVNSMNNWYELWSKSGANPNFRIDNPEIYISGFNWIDRWFDEYFFTKVSDFLLGNILLIITFIIFFKINFKKKPTLFGNFYILSILILLLIEWFYNHPSLRYGGYSIITLLIITPISIYLGKNDKVSLDNTVIKKTKVLIITATLIFLIRNIDRINKEIDKYNYEPLVNIKYNINDSYFKIENRMNLIISNEINCNLELSDCNYNYDENISAKKLKNFIVFYRK